MSCCYDTEQPTLINETWRTARKPHICCECRRAIKPGERYQVISGLWEGEWSTYKTCESCADLRDALESVWCVPLGGLRGEYIEYLDHIGVAEFDDDDRVIRPVNHITRPYLIGIG